ncbi:hypothetical protein MGA5115_02713 [Marinomonas gallaica]|uniref:Uncharacterized protein n=1 Tax=Marinomonas gallaica TaxID=1806667 RepID=A0A1C3JU05_9GAMM|nr:hypothetical protein [Marinomonas gallaica]SBT18566.1 hypothetical protein MGA5115_02713 [Marinomonas gallaica]SBT21521.1 hypothetical protein MGA5116_02117 [Marinomonas gallaica]
MSWLHYLGAKLFKSSRLKPNTIVVGIDTPSYRLASYLQQAHLANVVAFIDDEPWSNRTDILGVTVRYPSDLSALIERWQVTTVIEFDGNGLIPDNVREELKRLSFEYVVLDPAITPDHWAQQIQDSL